MREKVPQVNILIIDDDRDDHFFFINALQNLQLTHFKKADIKISSAFSGIQGINFLLKRGVYKGTDGPLPNFIVLDLFMPVVDGYVVLSEIKTHSKLKDIPVYILTSSASENRKKCLAGGCAGFFSKPPDEEELKLVIRQMLEANVVI